jgi:hypothetical protein
MYRYPIPNSLRDRAIHVITRIKERQDALRQATRHVLIRVAKCIDVDGGIFKMYYTRKLYQLCHLNNKYRY